MEHVHPELYGLYDLSMRVYELSTVVFSVPGTQFSVERLFSGLKFILSPYRSITNAHNLEDQLIVQINRKF